MRFTEAVVKAGSPHSGGRPQMREIRSECANAPGSEPQVVAAPTAALAVERQLADYGYDDVALSWRRSAEDYHIDPASMRAPHVQTPGELRSSREPIEAVVRAAQSQLDRLCGLVRPAGYVVLLCDTNGVAVEYRGNEARAAVHQTQHFRARHGSLSCSGAPIYEIGRA